MTNKVEDIVYILEMNLDTLRKKYFRKSKGRYQIDISCDLVRILREEKYRAVHGTINVGFSVIYLEPEINIFFCERITVFQSGNLIKEWRWIK